MNEVLILHALVAPTLVARRIPAIRIGDAQSVNQSPATLLAQAAAAHTAPLLKPVSDDLFAPLVRISSPRETMRIKRRERKRTK